MELENLLMNNKISYKIISAYQKVENDKERIKSKFNFNISRTSTNSSVFKQSKHSSLPTQQNSIICQKKNNSNIKKKLLHQKDAKLNITHYRPKSTINIKINNQKYSHNNQKITNINTQSKMSELSSKNKKQIIFNQTYENYNTEMKDRKLIGYKMIKNNSNSYHNKNINHTHHNSQIINNITYNNYNNFVNDNSLTVIDNQNYFLQDSILKTQSIYDYNSRYNNNNYNDIDCVFNILSCKK